MLVSTHMKRKKVATDSYTIFPWSFAKSHVNSMLTQSDYNVTCATHRCAFKTYVSCIYIFPYKNRSRKMEFKTKINSSVYACVRVCVFFCFLSATNVNSLLIIFSTFSIPSYSCHLADISTH